MAYTPGIDHGQDSARGGRCGLGMTARVRKVHNLTTRRNGTGHPLQRQYRTYVVSRSAACLIQLYVRVTVIIIMMPGKWCLFDRRRNL